MGAEAATIIRKAFTADIVARDGERAVVATITAEVCDRDGEVLICQGIRSKNYEANPVLLWMHAHDQPPIGRCESLHRKGQSIVAKFTFAPRPASHPANAEWPPDTILGLYQCGALRAFSVGFIPEIRRPATKADSDKYGDEVRTVISRAELVEVSAVTLPANPEAVAISVSKGLITRERAKQMFGLDVPRALLPAPPGQERVIEVVEEVAEVPRPRKIIYHEIIDDKPAKRANRPIDVKKLIVRETISTILKARGRLYEPTEHEWKAMGA